MAAVQYGETVAAGSRRRRDVRKRLWTVLRCAPLLASGGLLLGAAPLVAAQEAAETQKLDAVYVTGSNIPRTDIEVETRTTASCSISILIRFPMRRFPLARPETCHWLAASTPAAKRA